MAKTGVIAGIVAVVIVGVVLGACLLAISENDEGDIKGTYVFQKGTYAEIVDGKATFKEVTDINDIVIEKYENNNFYAKWGNDVFIGAFDGKNFQAEETYTFDGKKFNEICHGTIEGNMLKYTANCYSEDGDVGVSVIYFAKKGTTIEIPEYEPIWETGQTFISFQCSYLIDGEYYEMPGVSAYKVTVVDFKDGIYVLKNSIEDMGETEDVFTVAIHVSNNMLACGYEDGSSNRIVCTSDKISLYSDYIDNGRHIIYDLEMSSSEEKEIDTVPDLTGKKYSGTSYYVLANGQFTSVSYALTFEKRYGNNIYDIACVSNGEAFTATVSVICDKANGGYYVCFTDRYSYGTESHVDFNYGHISEDLKTYSEMTSAFSDDSINAAGFCRLDLKSSNL